MFLGDLNPLRSFPLPNQECVSNNLRAPFLAWKLWHQMSSVEVSWRGPRCITQGRKPEPRMQCCSGTASALRWEQCAPGAGKEGGLVSYFCITNYHTPSTFKQHWLPHSLCGSGVWAQLSSVLCSRSHKGAIVFVSPAAISAGCLSGEESASKLVLVVGRLYFLVIV